MRELASFAIVAFFCAGLLGCAAHRQRETPLGYACHRSFHYEASPRYYSCLFELSAPSLFYDDDNVERVLDSFIANEGGKCKKLKEREVSDVEERAHMAEHYLSYRLFVVACE